MREGYSSEQKREALASNIKPTVANGFNDPGHIEVGRRGWSSAYVINRSLAAELRQL
jgi:hypothetical protein